MREATDERAVGPIRIRISSSHPLARAKYAQLLSAPDFALTEDGQFDVAVFDSNFMSLNAVLAQMRNTSPKTRAIVLAESVNQDVCVGWAERGFWGVVPYSDCERNLANAICQVSRGQMYLPATVAVRLMVADLARKRMQHASGFTERERQVVDLLMRGLA